jgi:hypothetical protein
MNNQQTYRPRDMRNKFLGHVAYTAAQKAGANVLDATSAQIAAEFGHAAEINSFKLRVERAILSGPAHPAMQARYGWRMRGLRGMSLLGAIFVVERLYRHKRASFQIASALGYGDRLGLEMLRELRLILRWLLASGRACQFLSIVADVLDD